MTKEQWAASKESTQAAKKLAAVGDPAARKAAWATNPNNIRMFKATTPEEKAQKASIKAEKTAASKAKRLAAQPVREGAPGSRTLAAARLRTPEEAAAYQTESKAAREAKKATALASMSEARAAKVAALHARLGKTH
jgi:hypothetical protein